MYCIDVCKFSFKFIFCLDDSHCSALIRMLKEVKNWQLLGKNLNLPDNFLEGLVAAEVTDEEAVKSLVTVWLDSVMCKNEVASKDTLKIALEEMGETSIASLL